MLLQTTHTVQHYLESISNVISHREISVKPKSAETLLFFSVMLISNHSHSCQFHRESITLYIGRSNPTRQTRFEPGIALLGRYVFVLSLAMHGAHQGFFAGRRQTQRAITTQQANWKTKPDLGGKQVIVGRRPSASIGSEDRSHV